MSASINGNEFTLASLATYAGSSQGTQLDALSPSTNYFLLETRSPLQRTEKRKLQELLVDLQQYLGSNTWLCRYEPANITPLLNEPFVAHVRPYPPQLKIQSSLKLGSDDAVGARTVDIVMHEPGNDPARELSERIQELAGIDPGSIDIRREESVIRLTIGKDKLEDIANLENVGSIEEVHDLKFCNNVAREIIHADTSGLLHDLAYKGNNQLVTVADSGFDKGDAQNPHHDFIGRVEKLVAIGRASKTNDPHGHGTHVCGSVLGNGQSGSMGGKIQGTAPEAKLVMQSLISDNGTLFGNSSKTLVDLLADAYASGSRVHTNSWGPTWSAAGQIVYNNASIDLDTFVSNHEDMVVCFAAGNDGAQQTPLGHIGAQAAAKNCITVGACENKRKSVNPQCDVYKSDGTSEGDPDKISWFSSLGPTREGRIKPDVVAPGAMILSTQSRDAPKKDTFGKSLDPSYFFDSGTSMATPLVAGCIAVLRESLEANGTPNPTAALLKAMLVNGAVDTGKKTQAQGFGRVDLANSVIIKGTTVGRDFIEGEIIDEDGKDEFEKTLKIGDVRPGMTGMATLKVTMVYTDKAGGALQNDLNLTVAVDGGYPRFGNLGDRRDTINNVEQVVWKEIGKDSVITLKVSTGRALIGHRQGFALVWSLG